MFNKIYSKIKSKITSFFNPLSSIKPTRLNHREDLDVNDKLNNLRVTCGCINDPEDKRDHIKHNPKSESLGIKVLDTTLKSYASKIRNQGTTSSCASFAATNALYILINKMQKLSSAEDFNIIPDFSPLWVYWNARIFDSFYGSKSTKYDEGSTLRSTMRVLKEIGVVEDNSFKFSRNSPYDEPTENIVKSSKFKILEYLRIPVGNEAIKTVKNVIAFEQLPIVAGIKFYSEQMSTAEFSGVIKPVKDKSKAILIGGHGICLTGYSVFPDGKTYIEFQNQYGTSWGDKGYGYFPEDFLSDPFYMMDMWTFDKSYF